MILETKHIEWIDGAKGIAIICVILLHCLPDQGKMFSYLHIGQSVPVFVFITAYLLTLHYKSIAEYYKKERIAKIMRTLLPPFFLIMVCEQVVSYIHFGELIGFKLLTFEGGCLGPGSYYLSIYLSIWFIMSFVIEFVRRIPIWASFLIMLIISVFAEYLFASIWQLSHMEAIYRLSIVRYLMVVWLGCAFVRFSKVENSIMLVTAILTGLVYSIIRYMMNVNPAISIVPDYWNSAHWYSVLYVFVPIMFLQKIKYNDTLKWIGQHSWLIFCFQMFVFWCVMIMYKY